MWGALLSGGLSLLGGLGARQSAKSAQRQADARAEQSRLQNAWTSAEMLDQVPKRIAGDAEIAGFNPVTWLQGGALGYYTNAYQMRMTSPGQTVQVPSMLSAFADAGSAALNAFRSDARYEDQKAFQLEQLDKQLSAVKSRLMGSRSVEVGPGQSALGTGTFFGGGSAPGRPTGGGLSVSKVEQTRPYGLPVAPGEPDAQVVSDRQGDFWGEVQGTFNKFNDAYWRATGGLSLRNLENDAWRKTNEFFDEIAKKFPKHPFVFDFQSAMKKNPSLGRSPLVNPNTPWQYQTGGGF